MKFKAEVGKLLDIVVNSLYSEKQIFLRELISNASDACDKLKYMALTNFNLEKADGRLEIKLIPDAKNNTLSIIDNGVGMNKEDLINHLGTIAKSGTADFVDNAKDNGSVANLIGQFGVGFYSAFMVADKVEVLTKRVGEDVAYLWTSNGVDGFEIKEAQKETNGTEIKLFLKETEQSYTDTINLRHIVRTYSDHIDYPIMLCLGEAGDEVINSSSALWAKHKSEITTENYNEFYHHISKNFDEPWLTLHFKAEGKMEYTGLLYIPAKAPYDMFQADAKNGLKLYVNKVFISDKVDSLVPSYMRFLKGVVDSSDLQLNISREMLQQSVLIESIRKSLVARILKELKKRFTDYDDYLKFWQDFGIVFKEGIYEDVTSREDILSISLFASTNNLEKLTSLDDYISRIKDDGKSIYYITGDNISVLNNNPQLEAFKAKGIEVLLLTDPIDEFWTQVMTNYKGYPIKHITQANEDFDLKRDTPKADEGSLAALINLMAEMFKDDIGKVVTTDRLTTSPVSLIVEKGQMSIHLERLMRSHQQQTSFASTRILELNPYHPLIIKMADIGDTPQIRDIAKLLFDQAKIAEGEPITDPSFFAEKLSEYILKSI